MKKKPENDSAGDILGINPGHDATVVLIRNGTVLISLSEERLTRKKHHEGFPFRALEYVKNKYNPKNPKVFIVGSKPIKAFMKEPPTSGRFVRKYSRNARAVFIGTPILKNFLMFYDRAIEEWSARVSMKKYDEFLKQQLQGLEYQLVNHHQCHAWASLAFSHQNTSEQLIFTLDGSGDGISGSINIFDGKSIEVKHTFSMSQSIGFLYASVVDLVGMSRIEHEYKVMGLAPYAKVSVGEKAYEELKKMIWFEPKTMELHSTFDMAWATSNLISKDFNLRHRFDAIAYGVQKLTEEIIKDIVRAAIEKYKINDISLGGGVFMNVKANQYLSELSEVSSIVITPSCGDESLALGAAVFGYSQQNGGDLSNLKQVDNLYLGTEYSDEEIKDFIDNYSVAQKWKIDFYPPQKTKTIETVVAELLSKNKIVARFKGRAEWGARALGNRSILANPSSQENVKVINEMIKGRDFWMPFAPSLLYEDRSRYLENPRDLYAPFMAITFNTKSALRNEIIATVHPYDSTSRPQMVKKEINPTYHTLISQFKKKTGIGAILNTSFNLHGEPNVENPYDALRTFELSGLSHLAIGNYLCSKIQES